MSQYAVGYVKCVLLMLCSVNISSIQAMDHSSKNDDVISPRELCVNTFKYDHPYNSQTGNVGNSIDLLNVNNLSEIEFGHCVLLNLKDIINTVSKNPKADTTLVSKVSTNLGKLQLLFNDVLKQVVIPAYQLIQFITKSSYGEEGDDQTSDLDSYCSELLDDDFVKAKSTQIMTNLFKTYHIKDKNNVQLLIKKNITKKLNLIFNKKDAMQWIKNCLRQVTKIIEKDTTTIFSQYKLFSEEFNNLYDRIREYLSSLKKASDKKTIMSCMKNIELVIQCLEDADNNFASLKNMRTTVNKFKDLFVIIDSIRSDPHGDYYIKEYNDQQIIFDTLDQIPYENKELKLLKDIYINKCINNKNKVFKTERYQQILNEIINNYLIPLGKLIVYDKPYYDQLRNGNISYKNDFECCANTLLCEIGSLDWQGTLFKKWQELYIKQFNSTVEYYHQLLKTNDMNNLVNITIDNVQNCASTLSNSTFISMDQLIAIKESLNCNLNKLNTLMQPYHMFISSINSLNVLFTDYIVKTDALSYQDFLEYSMQNINASISVIEHYYDELVKGPTDYVKAYLKLSKDSGVSDEHIKYDIQSIQDELCKLYQSEIDMCEREICSKVKKLVLKYCNITNNYKTYDENNNGAILFNLLCDYNSICDSIKQFYNKRDTLLSNINKYFSRSSNFLQGTSTVPEFNKNENMLFTDEQYSVWKDFYEEDDGVEENIKQYLTTDHEPVEHKSKIQNFRNNMSSDKLLNEVLLYQKGLFEKSQEESEEESDWDDVFFEDNTFIKCNVKTLPEHLISINKFNDICKLSYDALHKTYFLKQYKTCIIDMLRYIGYDVKKRNIKGRIAAIDKIIERLIQFQDDLRRNDVLMFNYPERIELGQYEESQTEINSDMKDAIADLNNQVSLILYKLYNESVDLEKDKLSNVPLFFKKPNQDHQDKITKLTAKIKELDAKIANGKCSYLDMQELQQLKKQKNEEYKKLTMVQKKVFSDDTAMRTTIETKPLNLDDVFSDWVRLEQLRGKYRDKNLIKSEKRTAVENLERKERSLIAIYVSNSLKLVQSARKAEVEKIKKNFDSINIQKMNYTQKFLLPIKKYLQLQKWKDYRLLQEMVIAFMSDRYYLLKYDWNNEYQNNKQINNWSVLSGIKVY